MGGLNMLKQKDPTAEERDIAVKKRVREAIRSKGLKIKQFARESGMAYPSLRDYYSGLRKPGFDAIAAIVQFTGVCGDWILLGTGDMFHDQEPKPVNINEDLLAHIAREVAKEYNKTEPGKVRDDGGAGDSLYERALEEQRKKVTMIREHALIAANVYNRVAHIPDEQKRTDMAQREVENMVRYHRSLVKTVIGEEV